MSGNGESAALAEVQPADNDALPREPEERSWMPTAPNTPSSAYKSALEVRATGQIRGWVYNPADPSERMTVRLFVDHAEIATSVADQPEPKLNLEDRNHRFWLTIPDRFHDGLPHAYRIEIGDSGQVVRQPGPQFTLPEKARTAQLSGTVAYKADWLRGYVRDAQEPRDKHVVNLFIDGSPVGTALADENRADVEDDRQGHFFNYPVPMKFWDGVPHEFSAAVDGDAPPLDQARSTFTIPIASGVIGEVDSVLNGVITGWAADTAQPTRQVEILARIDGTVDVRGKASNEYPPLTLANGVVIKRSGFALNLPEKYYDGQEHELVVHLDDKTLSARSLCGKVFQLTRPTGRNMAARLRIESARRSHNEQDTLYDIVFVLNINSKGWILEKICRIVADQLGLNCHFTFSERNSRISGWLPRARAYFFGHYKLLAGALKSGADIGDAARFVWFTHPVFDAGFTRDDLYVTLSAADHVFTANTHHRESLAFLGIEPARITTVLGGADPEAFTYKARAGRGVGLVGAYYPRKNPDLMLALAMAMPETPFLLLAPKSSEVENKLLLWTHWPRLEEFCSLPNTRYVEAPYEDFPSYFNEFDIYLSVSDLEGGPIPLIEAMFSNSVPVVTRTGFAEDLVVDGINGYLVPVGVGVQELVRKIRLAERNEADVRATVADFTWKAFGSRIANTIAPCVVGNEAISLALGHGSGIRLREGWARQDAFGAICRGDNARIALRLSEPLTSVTLCIESDHDVSAPILEVHVDKNPLGHQPLRPGVQELRFDLREAGLTSGEVCNISLGVRHDDAAGTERSQVRVRSLVLNGAVA